MTEEEMRKLGGPSFFTGMAAAAESDHDDDYDDQQDDEITPADFVVTPVTAPVQQQAQPENRQPEPVNQAEPDNISSDNSTLSESEFKQLREEAFNRLAPEDRLKIGRIISRDDKLMWDFFFVYVFAGQSEVTQRIKGFYKKADEFKDMIQMAEGISQRRMEEVQALVKAFEDKAIKDAEQVNSYHEKAVAYIVKNTSAQVAAGVDEQLKKRIVNAVHAAVKSEQEALKKSSKDTMIFIAGMAMFSGLATATIGFLAGMLFGR
jgi:hypothetical protein